MKELDTILKMLDTNLLATYARKWKHVLHFQNIILITKTE